MTQLADHASGPNVMLLAGIGILAGTVASSLLQRIRIPQIVGYVAIGVVLGPVLGVIRPADVAALDWFNVAALGLIGLLIGGELKREIFVKFGRQVIGILVFEGLVAFGLVAGLTFCLLLLLFAWPVALSMALVFGAICAATDPASTVSILWEYKTRGPITAVLTTIVALDDALALVLYIVSVGLAGLLVGAPEGGWAVLVLHSLYEIFGSVVLGGAAGVLLKWPLQRSTRDDWTLLTTVTAVVLTLGLATYLNLDVILSSMACGVALVNTSSRRGGHALGLVRGLSTPVYALFFVLVGARFNVVAAEWAVLAVAGIYVLGSMVGKWCGTYLGAVYSRAVPNIRNYLGFCLYQQGTIAIALMMMAGARFDGEPRETMLSVIVIGVFCLQLAGPLFTRVALTRAGEVGLNVTEDDLVKTYAVRDVMDASVPSISADRHLEDVVQILSQSQHDFYPVVDGEGKAVGAITLDAMRWTFAHQELGAWLVALDLAEPVSETVTPQMPLADALEQADQLRATSVPVVERPGGRYVAVLNTQMVRRRLAADVLAKRDTADRLSDASATD